MLTKIQKQQRAEMAQQIRDGLDRLRIDKFDVAFDLWPDMMPASRADKMYRALKGTSPIPAELIDYCKKHEIIMSRKTIYFPQPVTVEYSDAAFYEMIEQHENPHFSESFVTQLIEAAPHYIKIIGEPKTDKSNMPPMTLPDIVLFCQKDIMKRLIEKYQL